MYSAHNLNIGEKFPVEDEEDLAYIVAYLKDVVPDEMKIIRLSASDLEKKAMLFAYERYQGPLRIHYLTIGDDAK